jgi:hypothetical protein
MGAIVPHSPAGRIKGMPRKNGMITVEDILIHAYGVNE